MINIKTTFYLPLPNSICISFCHDFAPIIVWKLWHISLLQKYFVKTKQKWYSVDDLGWSHFMVGPDRLILQSPDFCWNGFLLTIFPWWSSVYAEFVFLIPFGNPRYSYCVAKFNHFENIFRIPLNWSYDFFRFCILEPKMTNAKKLCLKTTHLYGPPLSRRSLKGRI